MNVQTFFLYDTETGVFSGSSMMCLPHELAQVTPKGFAWRAAPVDTARTKVDIQTGELVEYVPPAPQPNEWQTWEWSEEQWRWVAVKTDAAYAAEVRAERDRLLAACDWTQLPDVAAWTAQAYSVYRQSLRDITEQPGFPKNVKWPIKPT